MGEVLLVNRPLFVRGYVSLETRHNFVIRTLQLYYVFLRKHHYTSNGSHSLLGSVPPSNAVCPALLFMTNEVCWTSLIHYSTCGFRPVSFTVNRELKQTDAAATRRRSHSNLHSIKEWMMSRADWITWPWVPSEWKCACWSPPLDRRVSLLKLPNIWCQKSFGIFQTFSKPCNRNICWTCCKLVSLVKSNFDRYNQ